jgi:hypothetical protein
MKRTLLFFALALLTTSILVTGCKKDENPADGGSGGGNTQTGAGTMSAKIDGQSWSSTSIPGSPIPGAYATYTSNNLTLIGTQVQGTSASTFNITILNVTGTGEFRLGLLPVGSFQGVGAYGTSAGQAWATTDTETGTVKITKFDTQNKIVSGTFSFRCRSTNATPEIRNITDGVFDVKWGVFGGN